jgi:hypothetical protein
MTTPQNPVVNTNNEREKDPEQNNKVAPDEKSGVIFQSFFKISDPETGEIITQGRA